jgi:hypothetical protein
MRYLKPNGTIVIRKKPYDILFTLEVIDELQEITEMPMIELLGWALNKKNMKATIQIVLKVLLKEVPDLEDNKLEYYSYALINTYMEQLKCKEIDIKDKPNVEVSEEPQRINIEYWFYIGTVVLNRPTEEVWGMTLGQLITLRNEHYLYNGWFKEDKEVSIDEAIPI